MVIQILLNFQKGKKMKKLLKSSDFQEYFNKTDSIVASTIANDKVETFIIKLLKDPTMGAGGEFSEGYRTCLKDLMNELENK